MVIVGVDLTVEPPPEFVNGREVVEMEKLRLEHSE